jgi:hypothetical protein
MSARLAVMEPTILAEREDEAHAITASVATADNLNDFLESHATPQMFTPRKGLAAVHTLSHKSSAPTQSPRTSNTQIRPFQPVAGLTASMVASARSHVSTRPSSFLSSPSTVVFVSPKASVQKNHVAEPSLQHFQPYQRPRDVPRSLKDSYSRDAEMWGEYFSPQPPVFEPPSLSSHWNTPVHQDDFSVDGLDSASLSGAFDQVSPIGDIVERSRTPETNPVVLVRRPHVERELQPALELQDGAVQSHQEQRAHQLRSPSPETIAIKEATAVRITKMHFIWCFCVAVLCCYHLNFFTLMSTLLLETSSCLQPIER